MRLKTIVILTLMILSVNAYAQFNWPEDPEKRSDAQTLWTLFDDNYRSKNMTKSKDYLGQLVEKYPALSRSVYINGISIYKDEYKEASSEEDKSKAAEMVMNLYDLRFEYFDGEEKEVIDRKATDAFMFYYKDADKTRELLELFERTYELKGNDAYYPLGRYYMNMAVLAYARDVNLSGDDIIDIYNRCMEHINYMIAQASQAGKRTSRYEQIKEFIDQKLADLNLIDCDFITDKLVPEFIKDTSDPILAKKIFVFAFEGKCTDSDWFLQAAETYFATEPQYGVGYLLGVRYGSEKVFDKSIEYFEKAIEQTDDNQDKGKALKQIATTMRIMDSKTEAKKYALEAANVDPSLESEMYELIGDMMMSSSECDQKASQIDDRARFIAAYDYYAKAGNRSKMAQAQAQFPTMSEIFTANKEEGENIKVGCWIQTTVQLKRRPEQ